jgi:choline-glycine betaine transporter
VFEKFREEEEEPAVPGAVGVGVWTVGGSNNINVNANTNTNININIHITTTLHRIHRHCNLLRLYSTIWVCISARRMIRTSRSGTFALNTGDICRA